MKPTYRASPTERGRKLGADYEMLMTEIKTLQERVASLEHDATAKDRQILAQDRQILTQDRQILAQDQRIEELTHLLRLVRAEINDQIGENGEEVSGENGVPT